VTNGHGSNAQSSRGINLIQPLGYLDFLCLMMHARLVVTDSGGVQEETTCLRVPCVTVRENTERPVTFTCGTNVIAGTKKDSIRKAVERQMQSTAIACTPDKWDGKAAARIVDAIALELQKRSAAGHSGIKSPCDLATADAPRDERASNAVPKNSGPAGEPLEL
jgi:UDP-N-acetylglucosamine 2-epimerase